MWLLSSWNVAIKNRCALGAEDLVKKYLINNLLITSWNDSLENTELNIEMKFTYFLLLFFSVNGTFLLNSTVLPPESTNLSSDLLSSHFQLLHCFFPGWGWGWGARAPRHFLHPLLWGMRPWQKERCTLLAILIGCSLSFCVKRKSETWETCKNRILF